MTFWNSKRMAWLVNRHVPNKKSWTLNKRGTFLKCTPFTHVPLTIWEGKGWPSGVLNPVLGSPRDLLLAPNMNLGVRIAPSWCNWKRGTFFWTTMTTFVAIHVLNERTLNMKNCYIQAQAKHCLCPTVTSQLWRKTPEENFYWKCMFT